MDAATQSKGGASHLNYLNLEPPSRNAQSFASQETLDPVRLRTDIKLHMKDTSYTIIRVHSDLDTNTSISTWGNSLG